MSNEVGEKVYTVTVKGRSMREFKAAVQDLYNEVFEVTNNTVSGLSVTKNLETKAPVIEEDDYVEESAINRAHVNNVTPINNNVHNTVNDSSEIDSSGLRWDARIHSSSKVKNNDGSWKKRKGVERTVLLQVEGELRGTMAAAQVHQAPPQPQYQQQYQAPVAPPVIEQPVYQAPPQPQYQQPTQQYQPPVQQQYQAPVAPPVQQFQQGSITVDMFINNFPMVIADLVNNKKINQPYIEQLNAYFGIRELWMASPAQKTEMFNGLRNEGII